MTKGQWKSAEYRMMRNAYHEEFLEPMLVAKKWGLSFKPGAAAPAGETLLR
jgi:hypothetical protein